MMKVLNNMSLENMKAIAYEHTKNFFYNFVKFIDTMHRIHEA